jgi:hypothetical protein
MNIMSILSHVDLPVVAATLLATLGAVAIMVISVLMLTMATTALALPCAG